MSIAVSSLEFRNITKTFPGVRALDDVSFKINGGQVVALVGENGAGKSTLLKVLGGDYLQDGGKYLIDGIEQNFKNPHEAIMAGVGIISQERQIVPSLSVAENVFMEELSGFIDFAKLRTETQKIIDEFELPIKSTDKLKDLSVAYQQMVEIMKAYRRDPRIIAFDEPTASLSDAEIASLYKIIRKLREKGIVILYISHRMKELFQIADHVIIMKDGRYVSESPISEITEREIVRLMVGRNLGDVFSDLERAKRSDEVVLKVSGLTNKYIHDVSFELHKGEILALSGLVGAGRTETLRALFGADRIESGEIELEGKKITINSPEQAIHHGIALCPEDRKDQGIIGGASVMNNISIGVIDRLCRMSIIDRTREKQIAEDSVRELSIRTPDVYKKVRELSGGNQQKVILARWLETNPKVLMLDEPTKGIDVGAKTEIYKMICKLASQGLGVIFISSELPEVLGVSDHIVVMCQGHISGELVTSEATEEKVLTLAMADMLNGGGTDNERD